MLFSLSLTCMRFLRLIIQRTLTEHPRGGSLDGRRRTEVLECSEQTRTQIFFSCAACFPRPRRSSSRTKLTRSPSLRARTSLQALIARVFERMGALGKASSSSPARSAGFCSGAQRGHSRGRQEMEAELTRFVCAFKYDATAPPLRCRSRRWSSTGPW